MHVPSAPPEQIHKTRPVSHFSGKATVIGMFAFGLLATGTLWYYWELHTRPFRPLQDALAMQYAGSAPRVDGGRRKSHKGTARTLRFVMKVTFDPVQDEAQALSFVGDVAAFAETRTDLSAWEVLEFHLYELAESKMVQRAFHMDPATRAITAQPLQAARSR